MSREVIVSAGITEFAGWRVKVVPIRRAHGGVIPGRTAIHEAQHVVPNPRNIRRASIKPGPGYLGFAEAFEPDPIMAAGPHAMGSEGTSHDLKVIEYGGFDVSAVISSAREVVSKLHKEVYAVASVLQEKGEISGFEAERIMNEVAKPKAAVEIIDPSGKVLNFVLNTDRSKRHTIIIGSENELFDKAA